MPSFSVPQGRRSTRVMSKRPAGLVISLRGVQKMFPCLIVDRSQEGFRLRDNFRLRRGQAVEVIPDNDPLDAVRCSVVWIGTRGSKQEGQIGVHAEKG